MAEVQQPRIANMAAVKVVGLRRHQRFGPAMSDSLAAQWQDFAPMLPTVPHATSRTAYGVCFDGDDKASVDYLTGVAVSGFADVAPPLVGATLPAGTYAVFTHHGHVSRLQQTVQQAWDWLASSGRRHACADRGGPSFIEHYGNQFDPRTGLGGMEIWIPVSG